MIIIQDFKKCVQVIKFYLWFIGYFYSTWTDTVTLIYLETCSIQRTDNIL